MHTRTLVGHLKICDGLIVWADEDAHRLLDYPWGALTAMSFEEVLVPDSSGDSELPAHGSVVGRRIAVQAGNGLRILTDVRGERMEDRCALWSFSPSVDGADGERLDLLSQYGALTWLSERVQDGLKKQEFMLVYQPKVDMRCGRVMGFEALVRWRHPERGLLQPSAFVPMLKGHQLVEHLGDWAIGEALWQVNQWRLQAGVKTCVSVNISPRHLLRPDFIERLTLHLNRFPQLQTGEFEIELLETPAIEDFVAASDCIDRCKALGVSVVLDDFGTGCSSLTCLQRLPVSALKLDQSFVRGMLDNSKDAAIVRGILLMAHGFGYQTIAEGVESVAHGQALLALGCTHGQGYAIAKPLPAADVPQWIVGYERAPPWGGEVGR